MEDELSSEIPSNNLSKPSVAVKDLIKKIQLKRAHIKLLKGRILALISTIESENELEDENSSSTSIPTPSNLKALESELKGDQMAGLVSLKYQSTIFEFSTLSGNLPTGVKDHQQTFAKHSLELMESSSKATKGNAKVDQVYEKALELKKIHASLNENKLNHIREIEQGQSTKNLDTDESRALLIKKIRRITQIIQCFLFANPNIPPDMDIVNLLIEAEKAAMSE